MEPSSRPELVDPEFHPDPAPTGRLRDFDPLEHQRLVVNPFLAVLGLILGWQAARWLLFRGPFPPLSVASVLALPIVPYLVQYHCLDCGATGSYPRRRRHVCAAVSSRWRKGGHSRSILAGSRAQLVVWCYLVGSAALLLLILSRGS